MARSVGRRRHVRHAEPRRPTGRPCGGGRPAEEVHPRHVPVPQRHRPAHGPPVGLHGYRHVRPLPAHDRPQRAVHDGLRRLRPARRAVRGADRPAPGHHHQPEHRQHPRAVAPSGPQPRPAPQHQHHRPRLLPLDAVDLPAGVQLVVRPAAEEGPPHPRTGRRVRDRHAHAHQRQLGRPLPRRPRPRAGWLAAGLRQRCPGQLVPGPGHRGGQRRGHRRWAQRSRQLPGVQAQHAPMDDAHHHLRRSPDRRSRSARLDRSHQVDAAQLDRSQRGRDGALRLACGSHLGVHHSPRHAVRRDVHGAGPRASSGRRAHHPAAGERHRRVPPRSRSQGRLRSPERRPREDRRVHRLVRHQPGQRHADPCLDRRLRADGLRHRRHHGGAVRRPARLRVRPHVRSRHRRHPVATRPHARHRHVGRCVQG